jgi:hypothetical protein
MTIDAKADAALLAIAQREGLDLHVFDGINGPETGFVIASHSAGMEAFHRYQDLMGTAREIAEEAAICALESESTAPSDSNYFQISAETYVQLLQEIEYLIAIGTICRAEEPGILLILRYPG